MRMYNYTYDGIIPLHERLDRRKLQRNTYSLYEVGLDYLTIRYHNTNIVKLYHNGDVEFTMGGFGTVTTRQRINWFLPFGRLHQVAYGQYFSHNGESVPILTDARYLLRNNEIKEVNEHTIRS